MAYFAVVGGGIAGLTAANALVDSGAKVTLVEQTRHLGGRARTLRERGFLLNLGPHALYRGAIAEQTFAGWKIALHGGNPASSAPGLRSMLVRENQIYPAVKDLRTLLATRLFTLREKLEMARLLGSLNPANADLSETISQWLDRRIHSPRVRDYLATVVRVANYSGDFDHLSARAALRQIAMALKQGVLYLDGGWKTIVDALAARARARGVEIHCEERITRLDSIRADGIVLAVNPETVELLTSVILPARRPAYAASLDICLKSLPKGAPTVAFALDRPLYYSVHSAVADLAPNGGAAVHVMKYLRENEGDSHVLRGELEEYADLIMPGWKRLAEHIRFLPSLRVTAAIPTVDGRAGVSLPGMEHVTIAGDWVGAEGALVDAAVASALEAARTLQISKKVAA